MDSALPFVAGVVVGAILVVGLQAARRRSSLPSPSDQPPDGPGLIPPESPVTHAGGLTLGLGGPRAGIHAKVTVSGSRSLIRLDGASPTVEIDGVPYHRLADVPPHARELLIGELQLIRDTPNLPSGSLAGLDSFLADGGVADSPSPAP
jgi:hypothetical protein